jgi:hypothetical protein
VLAVRKSALHWKVESSGSSERTWGPRLRRRVTQRRQWAEADWREEIRRLFHTGRSVEESAATAGVRHELSSRSSSPADPRQRDGIGWTTLRALRVTRLERSTRFAFEG